MDENIKEVMNVIRKGKLLPLKQAEAMEKFLITGQRPVNHNLYAEHHSFYIPYGKMRKWDKVIRLMKKNFHDRNIRWIK